MPATTAPPIAAAEAPPVARLVADAIGTGFATQDFHMVLEIERIGAGGEPVSIYDQVLQQAALGAGEAQPVDGGALTYAHTDSLRGRIVDVDGNDLSGARIGFGLLDMTEAGMAAALAELGADGGPAPRDEGPVLVVYSSTNLDQTATHIMPGDQFLLDLSFVEGLAVGDTLRQSVVFGQALAMPEEASQDWDAAETFARRFTSGSIATLTDDDAEREGGMLVATSERITIAGSIIGPTTIKVLKYAPVALGESVHTFWVCRKVLRGGNPVACGRAFQGAIDRTQLSGRNAGRKNRGRPPCQSLQRCGRAAGDVHIRTLDDLSYDLQAAGEFVAARSGQGHELQLRMAPWGSSTRVSVNTGVAARIDGAAVSVQLDAGNRPEIHVDGKPLALERGSHARVGNGGALVSTGSDLIGLWPDGTRLDIHHVGSYFDIVLAVAGDAGTAWEGLLGSPDGNPGNDLALADGTVLDDPVAEDIHRGYADSWRVTDESSLFHYRAGESTATFTDRSFPSAYVTLEDLDPAARAEAERICRDYGISDPDALDACILDVALTGDPGFVISAGTLQDTADDSAKPETRRGPATLDAPDRVAAGSQLTVAWTGPANARDYITIATPEQAAGQQVRYASVDPETRTVSLQVPGEAGTYELRYILASDRTMLASRRLEVTAATATLDAPDTVAAGSQLTVAWTGPANTDDYIAIATPDQAASQQVRYAHVDPEAGAVSLQVPGEAGTYELRYILASDRTMLASRRLDVTAATATLDAPAAVAAGSQLTVDWTGPANAGDYIAIATPEQTAGQQVRYATVDPETGAVSLQVPGEAGAYELRYILASDRTMLASRRLEVTAATATLDAPAAVAAGSQLTVAWTGPANAGDYIAIATPEQGARGQEGYVYVDPGGATVTLKVPDEPGSYRIHYVLAADRVILASKTVEVMR